MVHHEAIVLVYQTPWIRSHCIVKIELALGHSATHQNCLGMRIVTIIKYNGIPPNCWCAIVCKAQAQRGTDTSFSLVCIRVEWLSTFWYFQVYFRSSIPKKLGNFWTSMHVLQSFNFQTNHGDLENEEENFICKYLTFTAKNNRQKESLKFKFVLYFFRLKLLFVCWV